MVIAIDIGGTKTRVGASLDGRTFARHRIARFLTPETFADGLVKIMAVSSTWPRAQRVVVAIPGVGHTKRRLGRIANLPGWTGAPLPARFRALFKCPVTIVNDATAAALGEASDGAGQGHEIVAYLTISTGIGGARVVSGALDQAARGFEPGHHILVPGGEKCGCGQRGCFEAHASGTAFERTFGVRAERCRNPRSWARYARILAQGIINVIVLWSPHVLVLGGGVAQAGAKLWRPLRAALRQELRVHRPVPPVRKAKLGDEAGLYGCLASIRSSGVGR